MKLSRQLIAALTLLAWFCAGAHVALEHSGESVAAHIKETAHDHHQHDAPPAEKHHHDLGVATAGQTVNVSKQHFLSAQWLPLFDALQARLFASLRADDVPREPLILGDSPPDTRFCGWLFVARTALQARGPSIVA